jgi:hypothetical protein
MGVLYINYKFSDWFMTKIRKQFPNNNIYIQVLSSWFLVLGSTPGERSIESMAHGAGREAQRAESIGQRALREAITS